MNFIPLALSVEYVVVIQTSGIDDNKHAVNLWAQLDGAVYCGCKQYTRIKEFYNRRNTESPVTEPHVTT